MSVMAFLLVIVVLVALAFAVPSVVAYASGSERRNELREAKRETALVRSREKIATKALRAIANGAGNPVYEAQDALDNIDRTYEHKELH